MGLRRCAGAIKGGMDGPLWKLMSGLRATFRFRLDSHKKYKNKHSLMGNLAQVINQTKRPFLNCPCAHAFGSGPRTEQFKNKD